MHTKFSVSQIEFEQMINEQKFQELADKLKANLQSNKIRSGDYEAAYKWLSETAKMNGKAIK